MLDVWGASGVGVEAGEGGVKCETGGERGRRESLTTFTRAEGDKMRERLPKLELARRPTLLIAAIDEVAGEGAARGGVHLPPGRAPFTARSGRSAHDGHAAHIWNTHATSNAGSPTAASRNHFLNCGLDTACQPGPATFCRPYLRHGDAWHSQIGPYCHRFRRQCHDHVEADPRNRPRPPG